MFREFDDVDTLRDQIHERAIAAIQKRYPIENDRYRIEAANLKWNTETPPTLEEQRAAIMNKTTLARQLQGEWRMVDKATNKVIDTRKGVFAHVPYLTQRGTYIYNGVEYTVGNQLRLRPGVYTRRKETGDLEAHFNAMPGAGKAFRVHMEPATGKFKMQIGQANVPLYPVLRGLGMQDKEIETAWGTDLLNANRDVDDHQTMGKVYTKMVGGKDTDAGSQLKAIQAAFDKTRMDPDVVQRHLGSYLPKEEVIK